MKYILLAAIGFMSQAGPAYAQVYWYPVNQQMAYRQQVANMQQIAHRQQQEAFEMAESIRQQMLYRQQQRARAREEYYSPRAREERQRQAENARQLRLDEMTASMIAQRVEINRENARKARAGEALVNALILLGR